MKFILSILLTVLLGISAQAQDLNPVSWTFDIERDAEEVRLVFIADIQEGWYLYAQELGEDGPIPTSFHFNQLTLEASYLIESSKHLVDSYDEMFGMPLKKYKEQVVFIAHIPAEDAKEIITGHVEFMCCNNTQCLPPKQIEFTFNLNK